MLHVKKEHTVYRGKVVFYRFCQWGFCMKGKSGLGDITTHYKIYIHTVSDWDRIGIYRERHRCNTQDFIWIGENMQSSIFSSL